jgi:hypothetical protein
VLRWRPGVGLGVEYPSTSPTGLEDPATTSGTLTGQRLTSRAPRTARRRCQAPKYALLPLAVGAVWGEARAGWEHGGDGGPGGTDRSVAEGGLHERPGCCKAKVLRFASSSASRRATKELGSHKPEVIVSYTDKSRTDPDGRRPGAKGALTSRCGCSADVLETALLSALLSNALGGQKRRLRISPKPPLTRCVAVGLTGFEPATP